jgi:putative ATPase
MAARTSARFVPFSAVTSGIKEIRQVMAEAATARDRSGRRTVLFVDEIHRFNRAQQDAFLPYVENGTIILIGATTENPSFEVNSALLSRLKVFVLNPLSETEVTRILRQALANEERGLGKLKVEIDDKTLEALATLTGGDARVALNTLELAVQSASKSEAGSCVIRDTDVEQALQRTSALYDKSGEQHYNLISAFIKSIRNSDADATLYWLARMIEGGEDPMYIARRIVHHASEDVGLADPAGSGPRLRGSPSDPFDRTA